MEEYNKCFLYDENVKKCGPCQQRSDSPKVGTFAVKDLKCDVNVYLQSLRFKDNIYVDCCSEKNLIESRIGREISNESLICAYHRNYFGVGWKATKHCCHPDHPIYTRGRKTKRTHLAPMWLVRELNRKNPYSFPIGGKICREHTPEKRQKLAHDEDGIIDENQLSEPDEPYQPEEHTVPLEIQSTLSEVGNELASLCNMSPIKFQVVKTPVNQLCSRVKSDFKKKLLEVRKQSVKILAESLAPNQGTELIAKCFEEDSDGSEDDVPVELQALARVYKDTTDRQARIAVLSLVDHSRYSRNMLRPIFGCSDRSIKAARKLRDFSAGFVLPPTVKFRRNKLDMTKANHFIDFMFTSGLVQDVAYGVSKMKFESGIVQTIPNVILTSKYSHVISFYLEICRGCDYVPLSETSLWRILRRLKPSKRKSLAGLDDITAAGMNGFSFLVTFLSKRKQDKRLISNLERGKRYLKAKYQSHCSTETDIASHNSKFALSLPTEEPSIINSIDETILCSDCYNVVSTLDNISKLSIAEGVEDTIHDVDAAIKSILKYMRHQMRDQQQRLAKQYAFDNLDATTGFWLKDFAQKVIPFEFREGQREYFGKKGMSLHIDVFFRKVDGELLKHVYLTCLLSCKQSATDVLNISDNVLKTFKIDCPMITKLFAKSDNATCYHGNFIFEAIYILSKERGFSLLRYDFNEPCKGKDQCDRESAGAKAVLNSCVEAGGKVKTAEEMFDALHYGKGIRNTQASVITSNSEETYLDGLEIKGVSTYHSIKYLKEGMKLYKYYDIGPGTLVEYGSSKFSLSYSVNRHFSQTQTQSVRDQLESERLRQKEKGKSKKKRIDNHTCTLIFCENASCIDFFESYESYQEHLLSEKHTYSQHETSMDQIKRSYVEKIKVSSNLHSCPTPTEECTFKINFSEAIQKTPLLQEISKQGWALPQRQFFRYDYETKLLLYNLFMDGERSNQKKTPEQAANIIRSKNLQFVTPAQIKSLFSLFSRQKRDGSLIPPVRPTTTSASHQQNISSEIPITINAAEVDNDDNDESVHLRELRDEVNEIVCNLDDWQINDFVAVRNETMWYPGKIIEINGTYLISRMEYVDTILLSNKFRWPEFESVNTHHFCDLLLKLDEPVGVSRGKRQSYFILTDDDFNDASDILAMTLK